MFRFIISLMLLCSTAYADRYVFGSAVCRDAYFLAASPDNNYGGSVLLYLDGSGVDNRGAVIGFDDIYDSLYAAAGGNITIESCSLRVYCAEGCDGEAGITAYRMFRTGFVEGTGTGQDVAGVTWNDWSADDYEWTSGGCNSTDDEGTDNSGDGTGADRKATAEGSAAVPATGYYNIPISTALVQDRFDTDVPLCLYLTRTTDYPKITSSEGTNIPLLIVNYTITGGGSDLLWPILK